MTRRTEGGYSLDWKGADLEKSEAARDGKRWGVILAGGDGTRLQPLTRVLCGDDRPKQFCALFDGRTLLDHTLARCARNISREQIIVSLSGQHARWHEREAALRPEQCVVQPSNRGTAPAIVHSLLSLARLDPEGVAAILPSDHYYSDEQAFTHALEGAFAAAADMPNEVILLGADPNSPEVEYGWIERGPQLLHRVGDLFRVAGFREKPVIGIAQRLLQEGALWNTFVMVGRIKTFLDIVAAALPGFAEIVSRARMWSGRETYLEYSVYERIPPMCFSQRVLTPRPDRLAVIRLKHGLWSDLGDPARVANVAESMGVALPVAGKGRAADRNRSQQAAAVQRGGV